MSNDLPDDFAGDLLGDITSSEPGLGVLLAQLTAGPTPDELAAERSALAMFRANRPQAAIPGRPRDPVPDASRSHGRRARRWATAVALAVAAALIVAAYTAALPDPLQNAAYHLLGFAGVPRADHAKPPAAGRAGPGPAGTRPSHHASAAPAGRLRSATPAARPSPSASPAPGSTLASLTLTISGSRIVAGAGEGFVGALTSRGRPVPGASLSLLERTPRQPAWHGAGTATTGADGRGVMTLSDLTTNAEFRLAGPHGAVSRPVLVIVVPTVSASVTSGPHGQADMVIASSPLADPGDTAVLEIQTAGGRWVGLQVRRLRDDDEARFLVRAGHREREYRVVLLPTAIHGLSVSNAVTLAAR